MKIQESKVTTSVSFSMSAAAADSNPNTLGSPAGSSLTPPQQIPVVLAACVGASEAIEVNGQAIVATAKLPVIVQQVDPLTMVPLTASEALNALQTKPDVSQMTLEEKFACLKQGFALQYGLRKVLCEVFESIRAEFKTYAKNRANQPTVEEAFKQRGLNYQTVYSAIQREKIRRAEDAKFFAAIKESTSAMPGPDVDNDLNRPQIGVKIILSDGAKAQVLTVNQKAAPHADPSFEVVTAEGTSRWVKRADFITVAEKQAAKGASESGDSVKSSRSYKAATAPKGIASAVANQDDSGASNAFYAAQYFAVIAQLKQLPDATPPADIRRMLAEIMKTQSDFCKHATLARPIANLFPSFDGAEGLNNFIAFLAKDPIGQRSPLRVLFGELAESEFTQRMDSFAKGVARRLYKSGFPELGADDKKVRTVHNDNVNASGGKKAQPKTVTVDVRPKTEQPPITSIGDKSVPTPHGFFYEMRLHEKLPYVIRHANSPGLGILCECKNKSEATIKVRDYEGEQAAIAPIAL